MPPYDTDGWDAVVQLGEPELDDLLACRFATGELQFPAGGEHQFGLASIDLKMRYDTPRSRLVTDAGPENEPGVRLVVPFDESFVRYNVPFSGRDTPIRGKEADLRGEVSYTAPVRLRQRGDSYRLVLATEDATAGVEFGPETRSDLSTDGQLYANIYEHAVDDHDQTVVNRLRNLPSTVSERVEQWVTAEAGTALPTTELALAVDADDATVEVVDGPTSEARCLLLAADLTEDATGHDGFEACRRPAGTTAALAVSTDFLLSEVVCPRIADRLNLAESDFEHPCRLASSTRTSLSAGGTTESFVLDSLSVTVQDGGIVIDGSLSAERGPADISGDMDVRIDVTYDAGDLLFTVARSDVDITVDVPWYVDVASWFSPRLQFAINTLPDLVEDGAENALSSAGGVTVEASDRLHALLDDRFESMSVESFDLTSEALVAGGSLLPDQHCPPKAAGTVRLSPGEGIDLDAGETTGEDFVARRDVDLRWGDPEDSPLGRDVLAPHHGAEVTVLGIDSEGWGAFETTDVVALDSLRDRQWDDDPIPEGDLFFPDVPFVGQHSLLFGTFTSEGRYAKCAAHASGGRLHLQYYTYQRPTANLRLAVDSTVIEEEQVETGVEHWTEIECTPGGPRGPEVTTTHRSAEYTVYDRAYRVEATASTTRLAWPLSFDWSLAGTPISGTGFVTVGGTEVHHEVDGATCTLRPEGDEAVAGSLAVEVEDNRDLTFRRTEGVVVRDRETEGGRPPNVAAEQRREIEQCRPERELTRWQDLRGWTGRVDGTGPDRWPDGVDPRTVLADTPGRGGGRDGHDTDPRRSLSPGESTSDEVRRALEAGLELPADRLDGGSGGGDEWP
ncbi:hypothetical protein [Salinirubrum litoreum]|uniref:Uncharacterized protein n=1 Tax=Salinirubrum litoreum TaxID=1126234 RepID=A0ABD5R9S5_9EURY|nr:hypothetical protein [Salinirubrum litoreum]